MHLRMFKCFLLYCIRMGREGSKIVSEVDVINITSAQFYSYCGSDDYFMDLAMCAEAPSTTVVETVNTSIFDDAVRADIHNDQGYSTPYENMME